MDARLKLEQFEGPLGLLLQLIEQEELNITDISLSQVTEQYFFYLNKLEKDKSAELADFLVIAAKLVYLKSRTLLPYLCPEEEDNGPTLADQLKMYKRYIEASKDVNQFWSQGGVGYGRIEPPVKAKEFVLPLNADVFSLRRAMESLIERLKPLSPLPKITIDHTITIKQKVDAIRNRLIHARRARFIDLLSDLKNRTEIIVSFLAVLDLVQQKNLAVDQQATFGEMVVRKI